MIAFNEETDPHFTSNNRNYTANTRKIGTQHINWSNAEDKQKKRVHSSAWHNGKIEMNAMKPFKNYYHQIGHN